MSVHPLCKPVSGDFHVLNVKIQEHVASSFNALLTCNIKVPYMKAVALEGPCRNMKREAIKDGMEIGKKFLAEGEAGAKSTCIKLRKMKWTSKQLEDADEKNLHVNFPLPGFRDNQELIEKEKELLPPGEGWTRHSQTMLVHSQSQVYFVQTGEKAGKYFRKGAVAGQWKDADPPHAPEEHDVFVRTASASCVRKGAKLDRAVLLNDVTKIARLALKMPLSFVDRPAGAYALFQGVRNAEAAQWCAENFHKKLLPRLAEKIHAWETQELQAVLEATLKDLDVELLKSAFPFSGCSALLALFLGNRLIVAGVGDARAVVLAGSSKGKVSVERLLDCAGRLEPSEEQERIWKAGGMVSEGLLHRHQAEKLDDAHRILSAPNVFDVLLAEDEALDEKQVRSAYRKLALRVHPDKQGESADKRAFESAFARLEESKEKLEGMLAEDAEACRELCRALRCDVHSRAGAAALLGVDKAPASDTVLEEATKEAEKASKELKKKIAKMQAIAPDYSQAEAVYDEAVKTIGRACSAASLPRTEALLKEGIPMSRALGVRDLRSPRPIVMMEPKSAAYTVAAGSTVRIGLLCGSTAALGDDDLAKATASHMRRAKASALQWNCLANASASSSTAVCICVGPAKGEEAPAAKKPRTSQAPAADTVRVRHVLIRHQQIKQPDPMLRREVVRSVQDAEEAALTALESLIKTPTQFPKICRELSDCQSGDQPGQLCGDLGWMAKGQTEAVLDEVIFSLAVNEFSDIVAGSRGLHIIQRLA
eukprot:TRINITY_DN77561_c0_g1_i1.p1 TRINITY_DN77561_c0_g1~~TRINITY_DN77561_c0_g1_i1.p1  ORF type:complete len:794 (-),score=206.76 TRINITY_DN77561_c0_g1_i1:50-2347(-)